MLLGSEGVKAEPKMLMKLTPGQPPSGNLPTLSRIWDGQHWAGSVLSYMCTPGNLQTFAQLLIYSKTLL